MKKIVSLVVFLAVLMLVQTAFAYCPTAGCKSESNYGYQRGYGI